MARERMVTRTITSTTYKVMSVNTETCEVSIVPYATSEEFIDDEKAFKFLRKKYETDTLKLVKIESIEITEQLYGMTEVEFMQYAKLLPPRGTKVGAEDAE